MKTLMIKDLARTEQLDRSAMAAVRGGSAWGSDVNVNLNINQKIGQFQDIQVNVLNSNGVIGAGFVGPSVNLDATQKAMNSAVVPKFV